MLGARFVFAAMLILLWATPDVRSQATAAFNQRDDTYRLLGLKRAKETFEVASAEYQRQKELFDRKLISTFELERARQSFADAEVNYQQSLLAVLFEQQYVSVQSAVKYYAKDGKRRVRVTLANTSEGGAEYQKLINIDDALFRSLQPDFINNVYVSLLNEDGATISQPYESKITTLQSGHPQTVDFALLQDVDAATVSIIYGAGSQRNMKVFLQKDASTNKVAVQSEQFSQEVDLGKTASFDLTLELFSGTDNTFTLEALNLPPSVSRFFKDPSGQARLSQVKFAESNRSKRAALEITLPDRPSEQIVIDKAIPFFVVVVPRDKQAELLSLQSAGVTAEQLQSMDIGFVRLELIPRGKGDLLVRSPQLFHSIEDDQTVSMIVELVNEGSHRLDNIVFTADVPLNWSKKFDPATVGQLEIGEEKRVQVEFTPPDDISPGKYEMRIRTTAMSNGQPVTAEDKIVTVEIQSHANVIGTIALVILILGLVGGMVVFGVRLSRK
jgi:uncharacterized membrane protein